MLRDCEFSGTIETIRGIEDCIRTSKKYTEGIKTMWAKHPIQGVDFPSKKFCKFYEVYPEMEVSWRMGAGDAIDLLWGDTLQIGVMFKYNYFDDIATFTVKGTMDMVEMLLRGLPSLLNIISPGMLTNGKVKSEDYRHALEHIIKKVKTEKKLEVKAEKKQGILDKCIDSGRLTPSAVWFHPGTSIAVKGKFKIK